MPALSVVTSVYNGEAFLAEAVESILKQTFTDFEFIIIDDGSTDRTPEILSGFAQHDPRVRIRRQANKGRTPSLNSGIGMALGRYIARMDADDIALPHRFKDQIEFLEGHQDVGLLGGAVEMIAADGRLIRTITPPCEDSEIRVRLCGENPFWHPTVMMRADVVTAVGGYRVAFDESEDYDLWLRIAERTRLANLASLVLKYRVHPNQASLSKATRQVECLMAARATAQLRRQGAADPLLESQPVTPELVRSLGVTESEVRRAELAACTYWANTLANVDSKSTLRLLERIVALCGSSSENRSLAANSLMQSARIYYRRRRLRQALVCATRGMFLEPTTACQHVKLAIARRARGFAT
jgi:Glycosyl transferase family 2